MGGGSLKNSQKHLPRVIFIRVEGNLRQNCQVRPFLSARLSPLLPVILTQPRNGSWQVRKGVSGNEKEWSTSSSLQQATSFSAASIGSYPSILETFPGHQFETSLWLGIGGRVAAKSETKVNQVQPLPSRSSHSTI